MCPWAYAQRVIFWVLERMLKRRLSIHSKGHLLGPWAYAQRFIFWVLEHTLKQRLSVCSVGRSWTYTQRVIFWVLELTLKGSFLGPWAFAQMVIFGVHETLKLCFRQSSAPLSKHLIKYLKTTKHCFLHPLYFLFHLWHSHTHPWNCLL